MGRRATPVRGHRRDGRAGLRRRRDPAHARDAADVALRLARRHPLAAGADRAARPPRSTAPTIGSSKWTRARSRAAATRWSGPSTPAVTSRARSSAPRSARARIPFDGVRLAHLVMHAELEAAICSGPRRGKQFTYALLEERAPQRAAPDARRGARRADAPLLHEPRPRHRARLRVVVRTVARGRARRPRGARRRRRARDDRRR